MKNGFRCLLFFTCLSFFAQTGTLVAEDEDTKLTWGITAITLRPENEGSPSAEDLLADPKNTFLLNRFYRVGGENLAATPTECRIAYNRDDLFVVFRCEESDLSYPEIPQHADWYSLLRSPAEQDSTFPDKIDLFIRPDMDKNFYYQFTVTLDELKFGSKCKIRSVFNKSAQTDEGAGTSVYVSKVNDFGATVIRKDKEWVAFLEIPWKTLGGKPRDCFGLLPMRTRWRDGEVSSPVAMDFSERPPIDLFIETHFSGGTPVPMSHPNLCQLPSGILRWQRPALLSYPDIKTLRQIWQMQQSLREPTDKDNFACRLHLTQRWIDLLMLEGFNFRAGTGSIVVKDMTQSVLRRQINTALQKKEMKLACQWLDAYLRKLDEVSRRWFADGSPGDILEKEWKPISELKSVEVKGNVLLLHCLAADRAVDLHLSLPEIGGIRIYGNDEGYFKPVGLLPLSIVQTSNTCSIKTPNGKIVITRTLFMISFYDIMGNAVTQIGPNGIAFRFSPAGKVLAVDFKNQLDPGEVICGFGEKYDRFNENGNVLTLWGMDDWMGNTVGLMNQSYKPIPVFHSSKGYMVFDNSSYRLRADIGKTDPDQYRLTQQGPVFDYYFWIDPPEKALPSYTELTGKPVLPPRWAFEPWMGRTGRGWNNTPLRNPVAEEERIVERFAKLDIPHSAIYSEGSGADSSALNAFMAVRGIKVLSWFYPVIPQPKQAALMPEMKPDELPVLNTGNQSSSRDLGYADFTNPNALELCRRWWERRLNLGVAGSMVDFGDRVPEAAIFYNGERGDEMHNFYSYGYDRTCSEVFQEKRGDDFILIGRAAAPGTQKWVAQFAGDHPSNFAGLQAVLTGALNLSACGFSIWGSDLGGFLGWPEPAVYMRWTQFACFSPLMRCHGRTPREPWNYGESAVANYKYYAWLRENLLDYVYHAAADSHETGIPIMRSMAIAYPKELPLAAVNDQYMFGSDLLVAPVVTENNFRTIYFPAGNWTSLWDGRTIIGPAAVKTRVPLETIPVYLKQGAVVPVRLNRELQFGRSMTGSQVNALIVTPPKANESVSLLNAHKDGASVILRPATNGFAMTLKKFSKAGYLLIYDAAVTAVKVDGEVLPGLAGTEIVSTLPGWCDDPAIKRVVIRLPPPESRRENSTMEIQVELEPMDTK